MFLSRFRAYHFTKIFALLMMAMATGASLFHWHVGTRAEEVLVDRFKAEELTLVRSGALAINQFFRDKEVQLLLVAGLTKIRVIEEEAGRETLEELAERFQEDGFLTDAVRADKTGKVIWNVNVQDNREGEGVSVADRDYFLWAEGQNQPGKIFISEPVIARGGLFKDKPIMVMVTPVFSQDEFNGTLFLSCSLEDLAEKYVRPLTFSSSAEVCLISREGRVVDATTEGTVDESVLGFMWPAEQDRLFGGVFISEKRAGGGCRSAGEEKLISVWAPIKVGDQELVLAVDFPYKEAASLVRPLHSLFSGGLAVILTGGLLSVGFFVFGVQVARRDGFHDGFRNGRDGHGKRKKKS